MRGLAVLFFVLVAGCAQGGPGAPPPTATSVVEASPERNMTVEAPMHPVGRAWTFSGTQQYNPDTDITIVVAAATPEGYLLAGAAEDDVVYEALWGNPLMGNVDAAFTRADWGRAALRFPLSDGASWEYREGVTVTARRASVEMPQGSDEGFVITGESERTTYRWDYSPALGQIVRHSAVGKDGTVYDDYHLTRVTDGQHWTWYELGALTVVEGPESPGSFDVPAGFDAVIASAGGVTGARASVRGPSGEEWTTEFTGEEEWHHGVLPATPGRWSALVAGRVDVPDGPELPVEQPIGWGYMHVAPVRWLRG
jgi:hypothetical protein